MFDLDPTHLQDENKIKEKDIPKHGPKKLSIVMVKIVFQGLKSFSQPEINLKSN